MFKDLHKHLNSLNNSRYFTGIMMLFYEYFFKICCFKIK